jgi:hypothetical protein
MARTSAAREVRAGETREWGECEFIVRKTDSLEQEQFHFAVMTRRAPR